MGRTLMDNPQVRREWHVAGRQGLAKRHQHGRGRTGDGRGEGGGLCGVGIGGRSSPVKGSRRIVPSAIVAFGQRCRDCCALCGRRLRRDSLQRLLLVRRAVVQVGVARSTIGITLLGLLSGHGVRIRIRVRPSRRNSAWNSAQQRAGQPVHCG